MRKLLAAVAVVGLCGLTGTVLSAQRARAHAAPASSSSSVRFGPQIDLGTNGEGFGIGGRAEFNLTKSLGAPLTGVASFDYFFPGGGVNFWEINANLWYNIAVTHTTLRPYVGGGLDIAGSSGSTVAALNLGGGTKFTLKESKLTPFVEARFELRSASALVLTGGILF